MLHKTEPALLGGFLQAVVLVASVFVFHWDPGQIAAVQGVVMAFVALFVRQSVVPTTKVAEKAVEVGTKVAADLSTTTVGKVGTVTDGAVKVIDNAVTETLGGIL